MATWAAWLVGARQMPRVSSKPLAARTARELGGLHLLERGPLASDRVLVGARVVEHDLVEVLDAADS